MTLIVAGILTDGPRFLAACRSYPADLAGQWEFPGGKVAPAETPQCALRREIAEELACDVVVGTEITPPDGGTWPILAGNRMRAWRCTVHSGTPRAGTSHRELRWLTRTTAFTVPWLQPDVPIVERFLAQWDG